MLQITCLGLYKGRSLISRCIPYSRKGSLGNRRYTMIPVQNSINRLDLLSVNCHSFSRLLVDRSYSTKGGDKNSKFDKNLSDLENVDDEDNNVDINDEFIDNEPELLDGKSRVFDAGKKNKLVKKPSEIIIDIVTKGKQKFGRQAQGGKIRRRPIPLENHDDVSDLSEQSQEKGVPSSNELMSRNDDDNDKEDDDPDKEDIKPMNSEDLVLTQITLPVVHIPNSKRVHALPALGLYRKPAFPGFYQVLQVQDQNVIKCLSNVKQNSGHDYIGGFMTKTDPTGISNNSGTMNNQLNSAPVLRDDAGSVKSHTDLHIYGTLLQIITITPNFNFQGGQVILMPHKRIKMTGIHSEPSENNPLFRVAVEYVEDTPKHFEDSSVTKALHLEIMATVKELIKTSNFYKEQFDQIIRFYNLDYPTRLADLIAGISLAKRDQLQNILAELNIDKRLTMVLEITKKDLEFARIQNDVNLQLEEKLSKDQRRYILTEQMKMIKKELGMDSDDKTNIIEQFEKMYKNVEAFMSDESRVSYYSGINRLKHLESNSAEFGVWRSYMEWLLYLPWGKYTVESRDIHKAKQILDSHHFGLNDVKTRLLEFMATNILKGDLKGTTNPKTESANLNHTSSQSSGTKNKDKESGKEKKDNKNEHGKIICLIGPPGVGKTSIAIAMAESLNRKLYRFSLGGMFDIAEIKGHRRTYVGSLPGKFVQALKYTNTLNPLIILDEIDKLGRDTRGDPASALLEALDPSQNMNFRDYYLDIPIDLSQVLFVCTANSTDTIPAPLLDRMELINIPGYLPEEKMMICKHFLIPTSMKATGLSAELIKIEDAAVDKIIKQYSREAGVRNLLKCIEKIHRKVALNLVMSNTPKSSISEESGDDKDTVATVSDVSATVTTSCTTMSTDVNKASNTAMNGNTANNGSTSAISVESIKNNSGLTVVTEDDVITYLGVPIYNKESFHPYPLPYGVVMGLAWTNAGGATMYVEAHGQMMDKYGNLIEPNRSKDGEDQGAEDSADGDRKSDHYDGQERELKGKGSLKITGHLGNVMTESAQIALTYCKTFIRKHQPKNIFLDEADIHIHVPEGATPKDGPSGGITMACALISIAAKKRLKPSLAMTGELTISGKILRIGGIKEKLIAAIREDVDTVILPMANKPDFDELDNSIKDKVKVVFVNVFDDVYESAFE
ncbi:endopeptidase La [Theileria orientalis]|uniref:endopeptidase La n=1 Tax=Theileria orientalis TaxID=68886 RepID=A0A976MD13_THEOR|nr:endopeptidase La [Theileria orientalis]